eukprot:10328360-Lingulodinium_polyedra.AAC.1
MSVSSMVLGHLARRASRRGCIAGRLRTKCFQSWASCPQSQQMSLSISPIVARQLGGHRLPSEGQVPSGLLRPAHARQDWPAAT